MEMIVKHKGGMKLVVDTGRHKIVSDQPDKGGKDEAPTPPELFIASPATCAGVYAIFYCQRHKIPYEGLEIKTKWEKEQSPLRIGSVLMRISLPDGCPDEHKEKLHSMMEKCMVHNSLKIPPMVEIEI